MSMMQAMMLKLCFLHSPRSSMSILNTRFRRFAHDIAFAWLGLSDCSISCLWSREFFSTLRARHLGSKVAVRDEHAEKSD